MSKELQGIIFIIVRQFYQSSFLKRIKQGIHHHSPP